MTTDDLLRATRDVYVLALKPGGAAGSLENSWSMKLGGLSQEHLRQAGVELRKARLAKASTKPLKEALKSTALLDSLARALGAESYDRWIGEEEEKIVSFLAEHGMTHPTDLIRWALPPGFARALTGQQVADRLFNSGLALPKRIFTGVGSFLFAPSIGRNDVSGIAKRDVTCNEQLLDFCSQHADEVLMRAEHMRRDDAPPYIDLTGRALMLNAMSEYTGSLFTLLGSNLMDPCIDPPVVLSYNTSENDRAFNSQLFRYFREEIDRSRHGWVDVLAMPRNSNLIFLRGANGTFDWVVRDQRDKAFSHNLLHPFFSSDELPEAMNQRKLAAHLYFTTGGWQEKLKHDAESRHYAEGGTGANWPGYDTLIQHELISSLGYRAPRPKTGTAASRFVSHRVGDSRVMVSPLVTIKEFVQFCDLTGWEGSRLEKARKASYEMEENLRSVNTDPNDELPASVTWLDAVAYCRHVEKRDNLPVRLLGVTEWRQIAPQPSVDRSRVKAVRTFTVQNGEMPVDPIYEQMDWGVVGGDGHLGENSSHCYIPNGTMTFLDTLNWTSNSEGLRFLSVAGFGEWLSGYQHGHAPAASAATGRSLRGGSIERDLCPVHLDMRHKGAKVGFRLCYVAHPDA